MIPMIQEFNALLKLSCFVDGKRQPGRFLSVYTLGFRGFNSLTGL
jgi:hypothetical protein